MSISFFSMLDLVQQRQINQLKVDVKVAGQRSVNAQLEVQHLQTENEALKLVTASMWQLIKQRLGVSDDDLKEMVEAVDLLDGRRDGKVSSPQSKMVQCVACNHKINNKSPKCLYCGAPQPQNQLF